VELSSKPIVYSEEKVLMERRIRRHREIIQEMKDSVKKFSVADLIAAVLILPEPHTEEGIREILRDAFGTKFYTVEVYRDIFNNASSDDWQGILQIKEAKNSFYGVFLTDTMAFAPLSMISLFLRHSKKLDVNFLKGIAPRYPSLYSCLPPDLQAEIPKPEGHVLEWEKVRKKKYMDARDKAPAGKTTGRADSIRKVLSVLYSPDFVSAYDISRLLKMSSSTAALAVDEITEVNEKIFQGSLLHQWEPQVNKKMHRLSSIFGAVDYEILSGIIVDSSTRSAEKLYQEMPEVQNFIGPYAELSCKLQMPRPGTAELFEMVLDVMKQLTEPSSASTIARYAKKQSSKLASVYLLTQKVRELRSDRRKNPLGKLILADMKADEGTTFSTYFLVKEARDIPTADLVYLSRRRSSHDIFRTLKKYPATWRYFPEIAWFSPGKETPATPEKVQAALGVKAEVGSECPPQCESCTTDIKAVPDFSTDESPQRVEMPVQDSGTVTETTPTPDQSAQTQTINLNLSISLAGAEKLPDFIKFLAKALADYQGISHEK
jgi:hypothetical protein